MIKKFYVVLLIILISSCSDNNITTNPITGEKPTPGLFSKDSTKGISLRDILNPQNEDGISTSVNGFLWRASLNVLSIAPLISTDAMGGIILTDWYFNKNINNQRMKISAYIKTSELRSDGIEIKVHLQKKESGLWTDTTRNKKLETQIENQILNEARNLRINSLK